MIRMKLKDIVSNMLSLIAIIIAILVWRSTDTRQSELRQKVIKYAVDHGTDTTARGSFDELDELSVPPLQDIIDQSQVVDITISNVGSLPVKDVTVSIGIRNAKGHMPAYTVTLTPALAHEVKVQDNVLSVTLTNPLASGSIVETKVAFQTIKDGKVLTEDSYAYEASVDSEVGAGVLVASLGNNPKAFGDHAKPRVRLENQ